MYRPRTTKRKTVEAAGTERPSKRHRDHDDHEGAQVVLEPRPRLSKQGHSLFLELPGGQSNVAKYGRPPDYSQLTRSPELRNRIYEFAFAITYRTFPTTTFRRENKRKRRTASNSKAEQLPFAGLTQSCSSIRAEFRPLWMDAHRIPLCALDRYLSAFHPSPPRNEQALKRFNSFFNPAGSLRLFLRTEELAYWDMLRLIQHQVRFPDFTVNFESLHDGRAAEAKAFAEILHNEHPEWVKLIRAKTVRQVRPWFDNPPNSMRIVMKEKLAPLWMKATAQMKIPDGYLATLGLDTIRCKNIKFGVEYS